MLLFASLRNSRRITPLITLSITLTACASTQRYWTPPLPRVDRADVVCVDTRGFVEQVRPVRTITNIDSLTALVGYIDALGGGWRLPRGNVVRLEPLRVILRDRGAVVGYVAVGRAFEAERGETLLVQSASPSTRAAFRTVATGRRDDVDPCAYEARR